ncbi:MAG: hypothetical protein JWR26_4928 [Pedosphaera sp.]|nr:hypothetical protein [Pedosphaera sp.]
MGLFEPSEGPCLGTLTNDYEYRPENIRPLISDVLSIISATVMNTKCSLILRRSLCFFSALSLSLSLSAQDTEVSGKKDTGPHAIDAEMAIKQFKVPSGFKVDLFAAEPQLMNPVAFCFDERGRVYVAETFRYQTSVRDIRSYMNMFDDDIACRTVEDRAAMIRKYPGKDPNEMTKESEIVRLIEDTKGTGRADRSSVFADGFNTILDGIGSGVLARKGNVYYTDIPNLWLLQDTNHTGKAVGRTSLGYGFGVHFNYTGHDMHGLRIGPDGKLYFSIGDRGLSVKTKEGKFLDYPDMGSVLRCNLDGSDMEMFAYGLRNPQELAFDDHGNLFTGDNNCDHGDAARLVYVVEGGDSGWRTGNQISDTTPAGVWNAEKLWHLQFPEQAAYIIPPVAHVADGPSGFTHYPGTGFPDAYKDHFFLCDFRGASSGSGVHTFGVKPKGAGFEMVDHSHFFWNILSTDVEFGPDGQMYVADWVQGWPQSGLGRIYRFYNPELVKSKLVLETKALIAEGMTQRPLAELTTLLGHADQRVRQEAQFEIVDRTLAAKSAREGRKYAAALVQVAMKGPEPLARLHAIWGLGQLGRATNHWVEPILPLMADKDSEVRAQTAKVLGEARLAKAFVDLTNALTDAEPRVRFFAAQSLGKLGNKKAVGPLIAMLRENGDKDVLLRHAGMMGLLGTADKSALVAAGGDASRSVRMAALITMRRAQLPEVAMFLHDADPLIVLEAARAINDAPITAAMPQLAMLIGHPTQSEPLDWRVVNANFRLGGEKNAAALAAYAAQSGATEKVRGEALHDLETWAQPSQRDRLTGLWRPLAARDGKVAIDALRPVVSKVMATSPDSVRIAAIHAAQKLAVADSTTAIFTLATQTKGSAEVRIEALKALAEFHEPRLAEAVTLAVADSDKNVRKEGNRLQAQLKPADAAVPLASVLEKGTVTEQQGAFATLGTLDGDGADKVLAEWMDKLLNGKVAKEIQLDLITAADNRSAASVKEKLDRYTANQPKEDEFKGFRETLYGGDAAVGKKIFTERPDASCVKCHKVNGEGGEVGPSLNGIITRHDREYILESILYPNKQIAPGFESVLIRTKDGQSIAGIVKAEDDKEISVLSVEDNMIVKVKKSDIETRAKGLSAMTPEMGSILSKQDLRNLIEFVATLK